MYCQIKKLQISPKGKIVLNYHDRGFGVRQKVSEGTLAAPADNYWICRWGPLGKVGRPHNAGSTNTFSLPDIDIDSKVEEKIASRGLCPKLKKSARVG